MRIREYVGSAVKHIIGKTCRAAPLNCAALANFLRATDSTYRPDGLSLLYLPPCKLCNSIRSILFSAIYKPIQLVYLNVQFLHICEIMQYVVVLFLRAISFTKLTNSGTVTKILILFIKF